MSQYNKFDLINLCFVAVLVIVILFILSPVLLVIVNSFNAAQYNVFPPEGFSLRWFMVVFDSPRFHRAFINSVLVGIGAMTVSLLIGTLSAWALVRHRFTGKSFFRSFTFAPITVPRIALGIAVFLLYIRAGMYGGLFGLVLVHSLLGLPYVISIMAAVLYSTNPMLEEAAQDLGATKIQSFIRVTLPQMKTGLIVAGLFAFITSFDELVSSLFLVRPENNTLPIEMFLYVQEYQNPTLAALATLIIAGTILVLLLLIPILKTQEARRLIARR
jgi:putative spermidine/putrescine transport system permease protein